MRPGRAQHVPNHLFGRNYRALANVHEGPCHYVGCLDSANAFNYDPSATLASGACERKVSGCTDLQALNYFASANSDDGSCLWPGCTNPARRNYDPTANTDDGRCTVPIPGCTDPKAVNFHPVLRRQWHAQRVGLLRTPM